MEFSLGTWQPGGACGKSGLAIDINPAARQSSKNIFEEALGKKAKFLVGARWNQREDLAPSRGTFFLGIFIGHLAADGGKSRAITELLGNFLEVKFFMARPTPAAPRPAYPVG